MTTLQHPKGPETMTPLARLDRLFDEWFRTIPLRHPFGGSDVPGEEIIRVEEFWDGDTEVIRAELPGIDPEKDFELTVSDGSCIAAQHRVVGEVQDKSFTRHELRYGSFAGTLSLPTGTVESGIRANFTNGILEIRIPVSEHPVAPEPTRISITFGGGGDPGGALRFVGVALRPFRAQSGTTSR